MEREVLNVEEAAERLGIGMSLAYQAIREGRIPSIRLGRKILIPRVAIDRMLADAGAEK